VRTTLLLTRHGQSTWNAEGRWQGQADPPLSDHGREQARVAADRIGAVDVVVSSPQQRALETAVIIAEVTGIGPVLVNDDLRERSAGAWSGLTHDDIARRFPGWLETGRRPDDFEPDETLLDRVVPALEAMVDEWPGSTVLVVCHGGVIRALETALGLDEGRIPNLSGRVIEVTADRRMLLGGQIQFFTPEPPHGVDPDRV
jgi:probable phosphoglycerate mutase